MRAIVLKKSSWVPMLLTAAMLAMLLSMGSPFAGGQATKGTGDRAGIVGTVSYVVRDPLGAIVLSGKNFNTVNLQGLDETFNRIAASATGGAYDGIAALDVAVGVDDPSDGVLSTSIALTIDGDSGTGGDQNPADGAVVTDFGTENGNGTIQVTFTASAAVTVEQIVLTRAAEDDTLVGGANAITDAEIFSYIDVPNVSLGSGDSVQYTWTIDVD